MKVRTVKKAIKENLIKCRKTPLARKVRLDHVYFVQHNKDHKKRDSYEQDNV